MIYDIAHLTIPDAIDSITDIYIPHENFDGTLLYPGPVNLTGDMYDFVQLVYEKCKEEEKIDFNLHFVAEGGKKLIFRGHVIKSLEGVVYALRKLTNYIPDIADLGYAENYTELLVSDKLSKGGLVLICGETGNGKSTTAVAAIVHRIKKYGSFCLTIEDPIEAPLQGIYEAENGKRGICYQSYADEEGIEDAIKGALRSYPAVSNSILFLGEIRSAAMASEVLKIAANGHLVFSTLHGFDLQSSLERFIQMASSHRNTKKEEVISMLSLVFRLAIHQQLRTLANGNKKLNPSVLFSENAISPVANKIKADNLQQLSTYIESQNNILKTGKSLLDNKNA